MTSATATAPALAPSLTLAPYFEVLDQVDPMVRTGEVTELVGLTVESRGPAVAVGDFCELHTSGGRVVRSQVVGFRNGRVLSIPLEEIDGLQLGDRVVARAEEARVKVGPGMLGRVLDGRRTGFVTGFETGFGAGRSLGTWRISIDVPAPVSTVRRFT